MRRLVSRLRLLALLVASLLLWLAPRFTSPKLAPDALVKADEAPAVAADSPPPEPSEKIRPAPVRVSAPAGTVFKLSDGGATQDYAVALDELYFPGRPVARRIEKIPAQADLPALLSHASSRASGSPAAEAPRLVLYPVGAERDAVTRRIVNPRLEVVLASADTPSPAPRPDLGIVAWDRPSYAPDRAIARIVGDAAQPLRAALAAATLPGVRSARPLLARQHFSRRLPADPIQGSQWHLGSIRATPAWDSATGSGVVVGIVDDGVDLGHPDLAPALDNTLGYDWNGNDDNPSAEDQETVVDGEVVIESDKHGTAVSGLAAARGGNRIGGAGVAPLATIAALRLIAGPTDESEDAEAMAWENDAISVKNNSWGPYDYIPNVSPAPELILSAIADGADSGVLYFFASGNGQQYAGQGSLDGYAADRHVIAVGASGRSGNIAPFSEGGPHLNVVAPGTDGIVTTDRVGKPGYTKSDYTQSFSGTSAAAPIASGVGALLLQARPDLGWRDVKEIFLRSSTKLQPASSDWVSRAAGDPFNPIKHHPRFGGGNVNALQALTLAETWTPLAPETYIIPDPSTFGPLTIPDNGALSITFDMPYGTPLLRVEHVVLRLDVTHPYRGDLAISLTSPSGVSSQFTRANTRLAGENYDYYPFTSVRHWGEPAFIPSAPSRRWTLTISDSLAGEVGTFNSASLTIYGTKLVAPALVTPLADQALATGSTLVLRGGFSGGNLEYVWSLDGKVIPGAIGPEYRLANFAVKSAGVYTCTAKNTLGEASSSATVTVNDSPRADLVLGAGVDASIDLSGYVDGAVALWKSNTLPAGLKLDPLTGLLTGRPTKPGIYSILISATRRDKALIRIPLAFTVTPVPVALTGNYVALVSRHSAFNADLGGSLSLTVGANAAVSGRLVLGKTEYPFTGLLNGPAAAPTLVATFAKPALRLSLTLSEIEGVASLAGQIETLATGADIPAATVTGGRSAWTASTRPATAYVGSLAGAFLPSTETELGLGATVVTLKVAADGRATWVITPSDGSPALTGSTPLTDQGLLLAHAPYANLLGSFRAALLAPTGDSSALSSPSTLDWLRKPSATLAQPAGFGPIDLAPVAGSGRYAKPAAGQRILGLSASSSAVDFKLASSASSLGSASRLDANVTVSATNSFVVAAPNTPKLALAFAADSGLVTGTYLVTTPSSRTARVTAFLLPFSSPAAALGFAFVPGAGGTPPSSSVVVISPAAD